jgi:hypothetical protein
VRIERSALFIQNKKLCQGFVRARLYNWEGRTGMKPTDLILVCVLPALRDLEIARLLGWYRIPLRTAPKVVAVDALAFYQPGAFGDRSGRVEYIAAVRGHELTTRGDLLHDEPDHPRAREEYFKVEIGPLERLPRPILADRWKRITFLYTTGEYLLQASTLNDLVVRADERSLLWRSLRERAEQSQQYHVDLRDAELPPDVLMVLLGITKEPKEADGSKEPNAPEEPNGPEEGE